LSWCGWLGRAVYLDGVVGLCGFLGVWGKKNLICLVWFVLVLCFVCLFWFCDLCVCFGFVFCVIDSFWFCGLPTRSCFSPWSCVATCSHLHVNVQILLPRQIIMQTPASASVQCRLMESERRILSYRCLLLSADNFFCLDKLSCRPQLLLLCNAD
jgi:hypothetical protein